MKLIKITKSGYIFIFTTIFIGFAAINTGNNLLYLITSCLLGFMGISGFFGKRNIEFLNINLCYIDEIFANREFSLNIEVNNNKKFFPSFLINVKINEKIITIPFIDKNKSVKKSTLMVFKKRGINEINDIYIFSSFPFNFFIRSKKYKLNYKFLVYPEPKKYEILQKIDPKINSGLEEINKTGHSGDLINIKEYFNDPIKLIHWKLSSKYDELLVKVLSSYSDEPILIDFDKIDLDLEKKLSAITYLVCRNENVILKIRKKIIKNKKEILKTLALL